MTTAINLFDAAKHAVQAVYISDKIAIMRGMQSGWYRKDGDWYTGPFSTEAEARSAQYPPHILNRPRDPGNAARAVYCVDERLLLGRYPTGRRFHFHRRELPRARPSYEVAAADPTDAERHPSALAILQLADVVP